jgi:hypothetical protein
LLAPLIGRGITEVVCASWLLLLVNIKPAIPPTARVQVLVVRRSIPTLLACGPALFAFMVVEWRLVPGIMLPTGLANGILLADTRGGVAGGVCSVVLVKCDGERDGWLSFDKDVATGMASMIAVVGKVNIGFNGGDVPKWKPPAQAIRGVFGAIVTVIGVAVIVGVHGVIGRRAGERGAVAVVCVDASELLEARRFNISGRLMIV